MIYPAITIITPISDRPYTEHIYIKWMKRMIAHYPGAVQVVVADDGRKEAKLLDAKPGELFGDKLVDYTYIRRHPSLTPVFSFLGNLEACLQLVKNEIVFVIEDDDWHSVDRLTKTIALWAKFPEVDVIGENAAKYYNVVTQRYHIWPSSLHSSLCQTAMKEKGLEAFKNLVATSNHFSVDTMLWKDDTINRMCIPGSDTTVGIKGLSPSNGLGVGHQDRFGEWDEKGWVLDYWLGKDADVYRKAVIKFREDQIND